MRDLLPRTFPAFLGRFPRLTAIQEEGVPAILAGRDVLLAAPTATGKTETYAAPLAERLLEEERAPFSVLIVSPTRALANDLKRRLEERMTHVGVTFGRHTGEYKERMGGRRPAMAVTTPEALDSLLARRPRELVEVRAVVLDEIHVLDGTVRGDQARVLLERLEQRARTRPQRIAVSATVSDAEDVAGRYLADPVIACHEGRHPIRARGFAGRDADRLAGHIETLARAGFRKVLGFCDRREDVEVHTAALRGRTSFGENVFAHHGSLARSVRERTERRFLESPAAVAFATLTLELGIDIGSVDYVLLLTPPPGVASLLQRIGRGSRRIRESRVGYIHDSEAEREVYRALLGLAARGDLAEDGYAFRPSVLVQQALVLAGSESYVTAGALRAVLPPELKEAAAGRDVDEILFAAATAGLFEPPRSGRFVLAEKMERAYDLGTLHSSFAAPPEKDVVDRMTGEVIGRMAQNEESRKMSLGGRGRRVILEDRDRILVDTFGGSGPTKFATHGRPSLAFRTARGIAGHLGIGPGEIVQAPCERGTVLLHGLGTAGALLLADALVAEHGRGLVRDAGALAAILREPLDALPTPTPEDVAELITRRELTLAKAAAMGRHHPVLPRDVRVEAVRHATRLDDVAHFLREARLVTRTDPAPSFWAEL